MPKLVDLSLSWAWTPQNFITDVFNMLSACLQQLQILNFDMSYSETVKFFLLVLIFGHPVDYYIVSPFLLYSEFKGVSTNSRIKKPQDFAAYHWSCEWLHSSHIMFIYGSFPLYTKTGAEGKLSLWRSKKNLTH